MNKYSIIKQREKTVKILVAGNKQIIIPSLIPFLLERDHQVTLTDTAKNEFGFSHKNLTVYPAAESNELYEEIFHAHSFDLVLFNALNENRFIEDKNSKTPVNPIRGLETVLDLSQRSGVTRFILISSAAVYGSNQSGHEDEDPEPESTYGAVLASYESLCHFYAKNFNMRVTVIRVPFIYGPNENHSFVSRLISLAEQKRNIKLHASKFDACQFLHIDDFLRFIEKAIEQKEQESWRVFNLSGGDNVNFAFVEQLIQFHFPQARIEFLQSGKKNQRGWTNHPTRAEQEMGWQAKHHLAYALPSLLDKPKEKGKRKNSIARFAQQLSHFIKPFLAWIEVILGAFGMHLLTIWTETIIEFKGIDYRLLYVVIIGSTYGLLLGVLASLLAMASAVVRWVAIGLDWELLVYNIENWIPFALYFLAGSVTGYMHDKLTNEIVFERNQTRLIHEKYKFLYHLYSEISNIKERLREQLVGYRDSFGRFFKVANQLDQLEEDSIFINALDVLEDVMKNDKIAIYTIDKTATYGRLEVKSANLKRQIPKSILLAEYSAALDQLKSGEVFQNKELLANYPAYIAPIMDQSKLIGLVVLWDADFEQFTLYYQNLFKVITSLIQSALVRAAIFKNAQVEELYLPSTQILKPEAFKQALHLKKKMKRNRLADFLIFSIEKTDMNWESLYARLSKEIRDDDIVGIMDENDDHCYVLFSNAGIENVDLLKNRLTESGFRNEYVAEIEVPYS